MSRQVVRLGAAPFGTLLSVEQARALEEELDLPAGILGVPEPESDAVLRTVEDDRKVDEGLWLDASGRPGR
jgi:hypothetical protein